MAPPTYKLYTAQASFRAFAILIAAEYNQITIQVVTENVDDRPVGKLPVLDITNSSSTTTDNNNSTAKLFSSHAAARYVAQLRHDTLLLGNNAVEQARINSWMDWCAQELELPACVWFYPVAGYMPFHQESYQKSKSDFAAALQTLNTHLEKESFLVNSHLTLADIVVVSTLVYPFKLVADRTYLQPYPHVVRWFQDCVAREEFEQVLGPVALCETELLAPGQGSA